MNHREEYAPMLSAYLDGELSAAEEARLRAHLDECEACREELAALAAVHEALLDETEYEAPAGFAEGVMARVRAEKTAAPKKAPHIGRRWAGLAACAALAVLIGTLLPNVLRMGSSAPEGMTAGPAASTEYDAAIAEEPEAPQEECALDCAPEPEPAMEPAPEPEAAPAAPVESAVPNTALMPADALTDSKTTVTAEQGADADEAPGEERRAFIVLGAGAQDYLARIGTLDADMGAYAVPAGQLKELPDGLSLSPEDERYLSFRPDDAEVFAVAEPVGPAEPAGAEAAR